MSGRPLRFLGATLGIWTLGRIAFLLPSSPQAEHADPIPVASLAHATAPFVEAGRTFAPIPTQPAPPSLPNRIARRAPTAVAGASYAVPPPAMAMLSDGAMEPPPARMFPTWPTLPTRPDRWSASVWGIARRGGGTLLPGGQLGGSQAGVRILRRLDRDGALAASLRLSAPLEGIGREVAAGLDWKPARRIPLRLIVEQRWSLDSGAGGTAAIAVTGFGPRAIAPRLSLSAYAQGGAVMRDRIEPFVDGAVRATTPVAAGIDLGIGLWGGAQRDAQRLDVGPSLGFALPVADRPVRLSLDWRQRIAGQAAPGSGPALTLAGDF
ncbi:hypothetical protein [uncultured Sphingomonas sp.]|uniref:hypothetical protein n=1 Tax=uncultured Sphingomonas sp. TaxID=158754 RepID=UPI0025E32B72|nr:hypothetical protein [uncultured Sphingomonas sp.]